MRKGFTNGVVFDIMGVSVRTFTSYHHEGKTMTTEEGIKLVQVLEHEEYTHALVASLVQTSEAIEFMESFSSTDKDLQDAREVVLATLRGIRSQLSTSISVSALLCYQVNQCSECAFMKDMGIL